MSETNVALPSLPLTELIPGLPEQYNYDAGIECALQGMGYRDIATAMGISQVQNLVKLRHRFPSLDEIIARARMLGLDIIFDESRFVVELNPEMNSKDIRTKWEAIKHYLACSDPRKYGERMNIEITEHVDLKQSLDQAKTRVLRSSAEAEVLEQKTSTHTP